MAKYVDSDYSISSPNTTSNRSLQERYMPSSSAYSLPPSYSQYRNMEALSSSNSQTNFFQNTACQPVNSNMYIDPLNNTYYSQSSLETTPFQSMPVVVNNENSMKNQSKSNDCLLYLGGNVFSMVRVVTPEEFVKSSQPMKPTPARATKQAPTYRSRQRKNYDSQSKHKILELYDHYIHSSKRMTVRNIAIAIFKDLKKEK